MMKVRERGEAELAGLQELRDRGLVYVDLHSYLEIRRGVRPSLHAAASETIEAADACS